MGPSLDGDQPRVGSLDHGDLFHKAIGEPIFWDFFQGGFIVSIYIYMYTLGTDTCSVFQFLHLAIYEVSYWAYLVICLSDSPIDQVVGGAAAP